MSTIAVTDDTFQSEVLKSDTPVLVDFWAEWCAPCKAMGPALEAVSEDMAGKVKIAKVNIDDAPDTPMRYHIRNVPTMMIFKDGEVVSTKMGAMTKSKLAEWLSEHA
ncbi:thioredoxin [Algimonas porphyrae]|uniref:Thioredoxin n=1 Tax=Algimonas porphyrae TaxID=1128113 RepID=A0ABQ5V4W0_9PROT|nr:thioredoxin [Algimonas porphyrae]GLQ21322.1 thioredoxin [Algimonas porphyrae]